MTYGESSKKLHRVDNCPVCSSNFSTPLHVGEGNSITGFLDASHKVYRYCNFCTLVYLSLQVERKDLGTRPSLDKTIWGKPALGETRFWKNDLGKSEFGKPSCEQTILGKPIWEKPIVRNRFGEQRIGETRFWGCNDFGKPFFGKSELGNI